MATDPYNMNSRELGWRHRVRPEDVPPAVPAAAVDVGTVSRAPRTPRQRDAAASASAAAAAAAAAEAAPFRPSRPTDVQRSLVVEPPADLNVERGEGRTRKASARSAFAAPVAAPTAPSAGEFVGPPRQAGVARKDVGGVFQGRAKINGVEQNVYSDSGFDPLFNGVTTTADAMARAKADPEFAAQYGAYGADRIRGQAQIAEAEAAAAAQAFELAQQQLTGERGETQSDVMRKQAEAAKNIAAAEKAQAEAGRIGVETDIADADATVRGSDRLNAIAADVEKEAVARFAADPASVRARWGDVDPRTAVDLSVMERLVQMGVDPRQTRAGRAGLTALEKMLNSIAKGGTTDAFVRPFTDGDWALNETANYVPIEQFQFSGRGLGPAALDWITPDMIEQSDLYKSMFNDYSNSYRISAGGSTPTTVLPPTEGLRRENLELLIESIRRLGQPRQ